MSERSLPLNRSTVVAMAHVNSLQRVIPAASVQEIERIAASAACAGQRIQEAEARCREQLDQTKQAAWEQGYASGHADALQKLRGFLMTVDTRRKAVDSELIALAVDAVARVLRSLPPDVLLKNLIEAALDEAQAAQARMVLRVHPDRVAIAKSCLQQLGAAEDFMSVVVEPDPRAAVDACTLETSAGFIDASLQTQLVALKVALAATAGGAPASP